MEVGMARMLGKYRMREMGLEHLHRHTDYSCLDGVAQVEEYAELSGKINQQYLCVTDHGMMGVVPRQINACEKAGLKPIFGCLFAGQPIYTAEGVKPIEDLRVGDLLLTHEGRFKPVVAAWSRKYSGPVTTLTLAGSRTTLKLTGNHKVLVRGRDGQTDWVPASEIKGGRVTAGRAIGNYAS